MNPIDPATFTQGSLLHLLCLAVCLVLTVVTARLARQERRCDQDSSRLRHLIVVGSLLSWILSNGYGLHPSRFIWSESLPLHFCNLANLIGALAVSTRFRSAQSLMYFWTFGLSIWAFLTPSLYVGPASLWFWLFWLYHAFILIAATWILVADGQQLHGTAAGLRDANHHSAHVSAGYALSTGWDSRLVGPLSSGPGAAYKAAAASGGAWLPDVVNTSTVRSVWSAMWVTPKWSDEKRGDLPPAGRGDPPDRPIPRPPERAQDSSIEARRSRWDGL